MKLHSASGNQYRILSLIINLPYCVNVFETNYQIMDVTVCPLGDGTRLMITLQGTS
jgi:hypothetical protein